MNHHEIHLAGHSLWAMPDGTLFWPDEALLIVSDMHLAKSERVARRNGNILPPYETRDTLARLNVAIERLAPRTILSLGDSFDDNQSAHALDDAEHHWISQLQNGRDWIWITGNHDPAPLPLAGIQLHELVLRGITFRHIAQKDQKFEISGHYHPKARLSVRGTSVSRPCFLVDKDRIILPAFGTYTGGLRSNHNSLQRIMRPDALSILTGGKTCYPLRMSDTS